MSGFGIKFLRPATENFGRDRPAGPKTQYDAEFALGVAETGKSLREPVLLGGYSRYMGVCPRAIAISTRVINLADRDRGERGLTDLTKQPSIMDGVV